MSAFYTDPDIQRAFLDGLLTTLHLSALSSVFALAVGFLMAFARITPLWPFRAMAAVYVSVFRNTPLLIQLFLYYRGLQSVGLMLSPLTCGILALSLYTGAYLTEVFRAGMLSVPREQTDAGLSLGLGRFQVYRMILLPQAFRVALPAIGNQMISLMKNSSLVAFITVSDLFFVVYKGAVDHFLPMEYFIEGALLYLLLSLAISGLIRLIEALTALPSAATTEAAYG